MVVDVQASGHCLQRVQLLRVWHNRVPEETLDVLRRNYDSALVMRPAIFPRQHFGSAGVERAILREADEVLRVTGSSTIFIPLCIVS